MTQPRNPLDNNPPLSRRAFLGGIGAGFVLLAAACGDDKQAKIPKTSTSTEHDHSTHDHGFGGLEGLTGILASGDLYAAAGNRFSFGVVEDGKLIRSDGAVRVGFAPQGSEPKTFVIPTFHGKGLPDDKGVYVTPVNLDRAGEWEATIQLGGTSTKMPFLVAAKPMVPAPGMRAPKVPSPTTTDPLGVDPICTRQPACPLHEISLDDLMGSGKPIALMFSTPARCSSRVCGPVLELMLQSMPAYRDRIAFLHVEIYAGPQDAELVPTLGAWGLQSEPWLFGIKKDGTISSRLDGAFDETEVVALLDGLVA